MDADVNTMVQGLPLGSGLGSSAASAAAGAWAVNGLFGYVTRAFDLQSPFSTFNAVCSARSRKRPIQSRCEGEL